MIIEITSVGRIWMVGWVSVFLWVSKVYAIDLEISRPVSLTASFSTVYEMKGHLVYRIYGKRGEGFFERKDQKRVLKKSYVLWGGEVTKSDLKRAGEIILKSPSGEKKGVRAMKFFKGEEEGDHLSYAAIADITDRVEENGKYKLSGVKAVPRRFGGSVVVEIVEEAEAPMRLIRLNAGIARLRPGEIYEAEIMAPGIKGVVSRVSTVGGDGKAGNGSSNSLNGMTLSGGEDWDGSSGFGWDVDTYEVGKFRLLSEKGLVWSMDPLLQWIYPMGIVVQIDLLESRGGENK